MNIIEASDKRYNLNGLERIFDQGRACKRSTTPYQAGEIDGVELLQRLRAAKLEKAGIEEAIIEMEALLLNEPYCGDIAVGGHVHRKDDPNGQLPGRYNKVIEINAEARRIFIDLNNGSKKWVAVDDYVFFDAPHKHLRSED